MKLDTWACDHCGKQRDKDANHWLVLDAHDGSVTITTWARTTPADLEGKRHLCGEECAFAFLARFFAAGGIPPAPKEWSATRKEDKAHASEVLRMPLYR
jgi:hypothetical protein